MTIFDPDVPRKNGELVFNAPWESRVFGMAVALSQLGRFPWEDFRQQLIQHVGDEPYYESWLEAFEAVLHDRRLVSEGELQARAEEFLSGRRDDIY